MLQAQLSATLVAGPASSSDQQFPAGVTTISWGLNPSQKGYQVAAGSVIQVNSPSAPMTIDAIGSGGTVTQATTYFFRTNTPMTLVGTFTNPLGGTFTATIPVNGFVSGETPVNAPLVGLTVQGAGAFEFWAAGLQ